MRIFVAKHVSLSIFFINFLLRTCTYVVFIYVRILFITYVRIIYYVRTYYYYVRTYLIITYVRIIITYVRI